MFNFNNRESQEFQNNKKWFNILKKLPIIFTIFISSIYFILGIVVVVAYYSASSLLLIWVVGAILAGIEYFIFKIGLSYGILHISYLEEILNNSKKICEKLTENKKNEE